MSVPEGLPANLSRGVRLHRRIDAYSNQHPGIRISCNRFPQDLRRLAPIFVDILADHCLARQWHSFHDESIESFTLRTYELIEVEKIWLPDAASRFFGFMRERDLLSGYQHWPVVERALFSITRRLNREEMNESLALVAREKLEEIEDDFSAYFPDMLDHGKAWVSAERQSS